MCNDGFILDIYKKNCRSTLAIRIHTYIFYKNFDNIFRIGIILFFIMVNLKFVSNDCHYFILRTLVLYYYNDYKKM